MIAMPRMQHVAVLIETSRAYGRGLLRGVQRYNRERANWSTYFEPHGLGDPPPPWLKTWRGNGILARVDNRRLAEAVRQAGVPVVNLRGTLPDLPFPFFGADNRAVGWLAAEHLLDRGFCRFGFCGLRRGFHPGYDCREDSFTQTLARAGFDCLVLRPAGGRRALGWEAQQDRIGSWLAALPKPVGIMTCNDDRGLQVLDACRRIGAAVPDEVAVIGVDNDEYLCGMAIPPLSSVDINSEETGYRAAELLDRLMAGRKAPRKTPETPPRGVVTRRSTDVLATDDALVVRAVRFIRDHACEGIDKHSVLRHAGVSRNVLEPRLRRVLGRTVQEEIRRVRIERAAELLAGTDMPVKQVAGEAGFRTVHYLTRVFSAATGEPPAAYRRSRSRR